MPAVLGVIDDGLLHAVQATLVLCHPQVGLTSTISQRCVQAGQQHHQQQEHVEHSLQTHHLLTKIMSPNLTSLMPQDETPPGSRSSISSARSSEAATTLQTSLQASMWLLIAWPLWP